MEIRRIQGGELPAAMDLCWRVFLEFEAPEYPPEGVEAFRAYLSDIEQVNHLTLFGAWEGQELLGVLAAEGSHIALFFVDPGVSPPGASAASCSRHIWRRAAAGGSRFTAPPMQWRSTAIWAFLPRQRNSCPRTASDTRPWCGSKHERALNTAKPPEGNPLRGLSRFSG